jgi:hypothetical protein
LKHHDSRTIRTPFITNTKARRDGCSRRRRGVVIGMRSDDGTYRTAAIEVGRGDGARIPSPQTSEKGVTSRERPALSFHDLRLRNEIRHVAKVLELSEPLSARDAETVATCVALKEIVRTRIAARGKRP